ncbi:ABC transporter permease [uncultured Granulicatella sp.]|uniref:ABC transporter permease n=1 Tax=uncultured Granulicatella sp. TaxID=316089 RepID=UPI0028D48580|nr:ABC transporter permease [uncultured Granulicatella sp.]
MKFWYFLKANLQMMFKQFHMLFFMIVLAPLVIGLFINMSGKSVVERKPNKVDTILYVENQDQEVLGNIVQKALEQLHEREIIALTTDKEKAELIAIIPTDFSKTVSEGQQTNPIQVQKKSKVSTSDQLTYEVILKNITGQLFEQVELKELVKDKKQVDDATAAVLSTQILQRTNEVLTKELYQRNDYQTSRMLTSEQYFSTAQLTMIWSMVLSIVVGSAVKPELSGLNKRMKLLPLSVRQRETYGLISNFIQFYIFTLLYVGIWKVIHSSTFNGNLFGIAGILAIQLFAMLSIAGFVSIFITEKTLGLFSSIISMGFVLFSGALPLDKMSPMFHWFGDNPFRRVLIEPIIRMMQQESVGDFIIIYAVIVIVAIIIAELQIRCLQRREEY